jgi:PAS domain S-box-containing protein
MALINLEMENEDPLPDQIPPIPTPDFQALFESAPGLYLVLTPVLTIVAVSEAYLKATMTRREKILGRNLFDVFPDNPNDPTSSGVSNLSASLKRALENRAPDAMAVQKYDIRRPESEGGGFEERYWSPVNSPVLGAKGEVAYIIHRVEDVTQRKRAEEELYKQTGILKSVLTNIGEGVVVADMEGKFLIWNPAAERLVGRGPTTEPMEKWSDHYRVFLPDQVTPYPADQLPLARAIRGESVTGDEQFLRRPDIPNGIWLSVSGRPLVDESGLQRGGVVAFSDITTRKRAEQELRKSEEQYRTLFDSIDVGVCTIEVLFDGNDKPVDYRFLEVNPSFEKQTGIQNARGRRMREIAPLHEEHWFEIYGKIALTGEPARFENQAAQLHRWYDVYAFRVGEPQERRVAIHFKNITERKRAEEALHRAHKELEMRVQERTAALAAANESLQAEIAERNRQEASLARLAAIVESSEDAIISKTLDGIVTSWNRGAERIFGYTAEEIIGKPVTVLIPPNRLNDEPVIIERLKRGERVEHYETLRMKKDGTFLDVSLTISPINDASGKIIGISKIARDISDRKLAMEQLLKKTRDLETLLYVTSHDLREPLRSIENFSRMVHDRYGQLLDDKGRDFLQRVVRGAQRMDQLMTDILALSRAQRMELPAEEIESESIVREALRRLDDKIKETGATVQVAKDLPRLQGNRTWATQGVYNLIANALKFSRNGTAPEVEIASYQPTVEDGPVVGIVVRDRGPGVVPEHAERIFQLFQRAVGREVEGTGAGLAIVRQVAERHGGRAWVQPREGGGSEFILTFGATNRSEKKEAP